jgi:hypothetical protein
MVVFTAMGTAMHRHCLSDATTLFHPRAALTEGGTAMVTATGAAVHRPIYLERRENEDSTLVAPPPLVRCHCHPIR